MSNDNRPMSPHLDVYRWRITMLSSVLHRASGAFLSLGLVLIVLKLAGIAAHPGGVAPAGMLANLFWFVWTLAAYYHLCNGIRHLVWDSGHGFELETAAKSARFVMIGTIVLTLLTWLQV